MTHPTQRPRRRRGAVIRITARGYVLLTKYELQTIAVSLSALHTAIVASDAAIAAGGVAPPANDRSPATDQKNRP